MGIFSSALGVVGGIFGGISASKALKRVKNSLEQQRKSNQDWYNRRYNEDMTQRGDVQALLEQTEESIRNRNKRAAGTQAVMGGTGESVAADKAAGNDAMAKTVMGVAASNQAHKDAVDRMYMQRDQALQQQLDDMERGRASEIGKATQSAFQSAGYLADLV